MRFRMSSVLRRAVDSAREALAHLEARRIPAALRPVVKASGLTPDLEARLVRELDGLPWLREKAVEQWGGAAQALHGDSPDRASALFLLRPDGWERELVRLAWEMGWGTGATAGDRGATAAEKGRAEVTEARERLRKTTRDLTEARAEITRLERAAAEPVRSEQQNAARERERRLAAAEKHSGQVKEFEAKITALQVEVVRLKEEAKRDRNARSRAEKQLDEQRFNPAWVKGANDLARWLDQVARSAERVIPENEVAAGTVAIRLPEGVLPDSADAMDHVLQQSGPKHLVVDGYNLGLALAAGKAADVRARLDPVLARIRTVARPPRRVTVVYDSSIEGSRSGGAAGVMVHFAPPGTSADDVIVALAAAKGTIVVSNDREVRERSERVGALALWSDAVVAWSRRRR